MIMNNIENKGSLMTIAGTNQCLGYLMAFGSHGVFEPSIGKVDVTPEEATKHNECLATAEIKGMDDNCQIGQGGTFYYIRGQVQTFTGTVVSNEAKVNGKSITFTRQGKTYRGRLQKDADCFNFRRVK